MRETILSRGNISDTGNEELIFPYSTSSVYGIDGIGNAKMFATESIIPLTSSYSITSSNVPYFNSQYPQFNDVIDAIDFILYVSISFTSINNSPSIIETGSTISSISTSWGLNKSPISQNIVGIGSVSPSLRNFTFTGSYTSDRTFQVSVVDEKGNSANGSATTSFRNKRYWGSNPNNTLTNFQILSLSSEFATNRNQSKTINGNGEYVWFAWPATFGSPTFNIDGFQNSDFSSFTQSFTNASGFTTNYYLFKTNNIQNASSLFTVT